MKKTLRRALSLLLAALTCSAALAFCVNAGVNGEVNTSADSLYIGKKPVIDGNVSLEEWGEPIAHVIVGMTRKNYIYDENNNVSVSDFCYLLPHGIKYINPLSFDFFLRWDTDHLYLAVAAQDPYGFSVREDLKDGSGKNVNQYRYFKDASGKYFDILYWVYNSCNDLTPWVDDGSGNAVEISKKEEKTGSRIARYTDENGATAETSELETHVVSYGKNGELISIAALWDGDCLQFGINSPSEGVQGPIGKNNPFCSDTNTYIFGMYEDKCYFMSDARGILTDFEGAIVWHDDMYENGGDWRMCGKSGGSPNTVPGYTVFELAIPASTYDADGKNTSGDVLGITMARVSGTTSEPVAVAGGDPKYFPRGLDATGEMPLDDNGLIIADALNEKQGGLDSWITWGDGVMGSSAEQPTKFRGGANAVTLAGGPSEPDVLRGDVNGDGVLTNADAIYLLRNIMLGDSYPINQGGDMNGDGTITNADAIYLLRNIMLGDTYPLAPDNG